MDSEPQATNRYTIPGAGKDREEVVFRPYFIHEGNICSHCGLPILTHSTPGFWRGSRTGSRMEMWHWGCFNGEFVVNHRDERAYEDATRQRGAPGSSIR